MNSCIAAAPSCSSQGVVYHAFFDPGEYDFATYKSDVLCKQFIKRFTLQLEGEVFLV